MPQEPLNSYELLDFVLTHSSTYSVAKIAELAGVQGAHVRTGLLGKRPIPRGSVGRLAAVVGLKMEISELDEVSFLIQPDSVINLAVNLNELETLKQVTQAFGSGNPVWKFIQAKGDDGVYLSALACLESGSYSLRYGYVVAHLTDKLLQAGLNCIRGQLAGKKALPAPNLGVESHDWIRLRAGMQSASELQLLFKVGGEPEPTARDWAEVFMEAARLGMGPGDIILGMQQLDRALQAADRKG